jgi:hypothetical protein
LLKLLEYQSDRFIGPKGQDPFWSAHIPQRDLFSARTSADIFVEPELPETSDIDHSPITTTYLFGGSDTQSADPNWAIPLQMAHSTMVPNTMTIPTRNTVASQTPIGTPLSPRLTHHFPLDIMR